MTDLEQLKQQLLEKLQASSKPEQEPSELDFLKSSQLPAYRELRRQTEQQWKRSPIQGAIPSSEPHLEIVTDALLDAIDRLTFAHHLLESTGISKSHTALFTAVCDGLNATNEAIERCSDAPDEDRVTDADLENLNPFGE
jgi:hypothetical protein